MSFPQSSLGVLSICALRYCIGKKTHMPSWVVDAVKQNWGNIGDKEKVIIESALKSRIWAIEIGIDREDDKYNIDTWNEFAEWIKKDKEAKQEVPPSPRNT